MHRAAFLLLVLAMPVSAQDGAVVLIQSMNFIDATPKLDTKDSSGSAVVIGKKDDHYYVLTAKHCVEKVKTCTLTFRRTNEEWQKGTFRFDATRTGDANVIAVSKDSDLALLKLKADFSIPVVSLAKSDPSPRDSCGAVGWGKGSFDTNNGTVRKVSSDFIYMGAFVAPGYSGGPLLSFGEKLDDWRVLGICSGSIKDEKLDIFVSVSRIRAFIKSTDHAWILDK